MNGVYKSLKVKVQDTLQLGKSNFTPGLGEKSGKVSSLNDEMEMLEQVVAERMSRLKAAVKEGEAALANESRQSQQVIESLEASIAALEAKLKETDEGVRKKDSARQQIEETLKAKIHELQNGLKTKEEALAALGKEVNDLRASVERRAKQISELESASEKAKHELASHAQREEDLAAASRVKIAALESQLKEKEEFARQKESALKELEKKLAAKIQDFESLAKNKQDLLAGRDAVISDLKSQLRLLTKGIGEMSSFFRQAQAFAVVERQDVSPAFQNAPVNAKEERPSFKTIAARLAPLEQKETAALQSNGSNATAIVQEEKPAAGEVNGAKAMAVAEEENPAAAQANGAKLTPINPDAGLEILPPDVFELMSSELAEFAGVMSPLAALIVREHVEGLGESMEKFPKTRLPELLDSLSREILDEKRQSDFRKKLAQNAQATAN